MWCRLIFVMNYYYFLPYRWVVVRAPAASDSVTVFYNYPIIFAFLPGFGFISFSIKEPNIRYSEINSIFKNVAKDFKSLIIYCELFVVENTQRPVWEESYCVVVMWKWGWGVKLFCTRVLAVNHPSDLSTRSL